MILEEESLPQKKWLREKKRKSHLRTRPRGGERWAEVTVNTSTFDSFPFRFMRLNYESKTFEKFNHVN